MWTRRLAHARRLGVVTTLVTAAVVAVAAGADVGAQSGSSPLSPDDLAVETSGGRDTVSLDPVLRTATGVETVFVRLAARPILRGGTDAAITAQQDAVVDDVAALGADEIGRVSRVLNGVFLEIDASRLDELAADRRVRSVSLVHDYELALSETVPYIGASTLHGQSVTGDGVVVAVLDSGIDYTHAALGGAGTVEAWEAAAGAASTDPQSAVLDEQFPSAKVIGGYDFVGETWTGAAGSPALAADVDPIDRGGHGTHVADIIAGEAGVAPGASLLAVKVCSAVSSACSGVAMLQGFDYAVDPDDNPATDDGADIVNMSLGSNYGTAFDQELSLAIDTATAAGVLTVAASGNLGDKPFATSTPAAAPTALSVAQTTMPGDTYVTLDPAESETGAFAVPQRWAPAPSTPLTAEMQYGDGAGGNLLACAAFADGALAGKIAIVDRGTCLFSAKSAFAAAAGAVAVVIANNVDGPLFTGSTGGETITVPTYLVSRTDGDRLADLAGSDLVIDHATQFSGAGAMAISSSRGPSMGAVSIKPEIGAPGASVSAEVGTGTGTSAFSGTSGATPMVAGAAALLREQYPERGALEIKANLMNSAMTDVFVVPEQVGGQPAPISRIGAGEVRVDDASAANLVASVVDGSSAALSFGQVDAAEIVTLTRTVEVTNYSDASEVVPVGATFRRADDEARGGVTIAVPAEITVPASGSVMFDVTIEIDPTKLPTWSLNSGSNGVNPLVLDLAEYDGYVQIGSLNMPWHVLPRAVPRASIEGTSIVNDGAVSTDLSVFAHLGTDPDDPNPAQGSGRAPGDLAEMGYRTILGTTSCYVDDQAVVQFGVRTWDHRTHASSPIDVAVDVDTDDDGDPDVQVLSTPFTTSLSDASNVVVIYDYASDTYSDSGFFTTHDVETGVTILTVCAADIGVLDADLGRARATFLTYDMVRRVSTFSERVADVSDEFQIDLGGQRHVLLDGASPVTRVQVAPGASKTLSVGEADSESADTGILLLQRRTGTDEALVVLPPGAPSQLTASGGDRVVDLAWTAPTVSGDAPLIGYRIEQSTDGFEFDVVVENTGTIATTHQVTGLTNGTAYSYRVAGVTMGGVGMFTTRTSDVRPSAVAAAPARPTATPGDGSVTVRWTAPTDTGGLVVSGYRVQMSTNGGAYRTVASVSGSARSHTVTNLANGTRYRFRVAAFNGRGLGADSAPTGAVRPRTVPGVPQSVAATAGRRSVTVTWSAPRSNGGARVTGYVVQVSVDGGAWTTVSSSIDPSSRSLLVRRLASGVPHRFRVAAVNAAGQGATARSGVVTPR